MSRNESTSAVRDLIYLVSCTLNRTKPNPEKLSAMDDKAVFAAARHHMLSAAAAYALRQVKSPEDYWVEAYVMSIRTQVLYDTERKKIFDAMDKAGIRHLPLKGILLKHYYPEPEIREMSDNDILCDSDRMEDVRSIMTGLGFDCAMFGKYIHDKYTKAPLNFEMHRALFVPYDVPQIAAYYQSIWDRAIRDGEGSGYHLTDEDFYLYNLSHMYKHYIKSGTGLRSLADMYAYLRAMGDRLDRAYLDAELEKLGLTEFEQKTRSLAQKAFGGGELTDDGMEELAYFIDSGCYGFQMNAVMNRLDRDGGRGAKLRYVRKRLFPDRIYLKSFYPTVYRHRVLYPFLVMYRPVKGLIKKRRRLRREMTFLREYNTKFH